MKLLSTIQSALIGLANTAPTYGIAVAGGALLAVAGIFSPLMILACLLVILGIFYAGSKLNARMPSYGSVYTWARNDIHPLVGFLAGWFSFAALCLFLMYVSVYVVDIFLETFLPTISIPQSAVILVAVMIIAIMVYIATKGISVTARFQNFFTYIELALLAFFAVFFIQTLIHTGIPAISLGQGLTRESAVSGFLLAIFFFWGWEVVFNLSEDSENKRETPRRSGTATLLLLGAIYIIFMALFAVLIPTSALTDASNLFSAFDNGVLPHSLYLLAMVGVIISIIGAIDIAIVEGAKELIAQSRDGLSLRRFSVLNPTTNAPISALVAVGIVATIGIVLSSYIEGAQIVLTAGVAISTLLIACYYCLMPVTWLWSSIRGTDTSIKSALYTVIIPALSAFIFLFVIVETFIGFDTFSKATFASIALVGTALYIFFAHIYKRLS